MYFFKQACFLLVKFYQSLTVLLLQKEACCKHVDILNMAAFFGKWERSRYMKWGKLATEKGQKKKLFSFNDNDRVLKCIKT